MRPDKQKQMMSYLTRPKINDDERIGLKKVHYQKQAQLKLMSISFLLIQVVE
jgi:hypothetical protein